MNNPIVRRAIAIATAFLLAELGARIAVSQGFLPAIDAPLLASFAQRKPNAVAGTDGFRVTTGQPTAYTRTVWVLGASNVFLPELPDSDTIPSQLQALMSDVRVVNASLIGANTAQSEIRLHDLPIKRGDMVILVGGSMESYAIWRTADNERGSRLTDGLCNVLLPRVGLGIVKLLCWEQQYNAPGLWDDRLYTYTLEQIGVWKRGTDRIRTYLDGRGVAFVNVIAPYCHCQYLSDYTGSQRAFDAFASVARDYDAIDLSRAVPDEDFTSYAHTNAAGSKIVAVALYKSITGNSPDTNK